MTQRLIDAFVRRTPAVAPATLAALASLTTREGEVLELLAEGRSNVEVAERLFVAETTVKTHVSRTLLNLGLRSRAQAVALAHQAGSVYGREPPT